MGRIDGRRVIPGCERSRRTARYIFIRSIAPLADYGPLFVTRAFSRSRIVLFLPVSLFLARASLSSCFRLSRPVFSSTFALRSLASKFCRVLSPSLLPRAPASPLSTSECASPLSFVALPSAPCPFLFPFSDARIPSAFSFVSPFSPPSVCDLAAVPLSFPVVRLRF